MEKELFCCLCDREYSDMNLPRLFPACGHSYCENCIRNLMGLNKQKEIRIICPQDHIEMKFDQKDINHFPKNISLIKLMSATRGGSRRSINLSRDESGFSDLHQELEQLDAHENPSPTSLKCSKTLPNSSLSLKSKSVVSEDTLNEQQICLIHQKPLEIVCVQHKTLICSSCAIFGEHKGHDFKSLREMEKDKIVKEQRILRVIDRKEELMRHAERKDEEAKIIQLKKDMLTQELRSKYAKLYDLVKFSEKKSVEKLNKFFSNLEEKFKAETNDIQRPLKLYSEWEERAVKEVDSFEKGTNLEEQIVYLGYDEETNGDVLHQGQRIMRELEETIDNVHKSFDQTIEVIELVVNEDVERDINNYVTFKDQKGIMNTSTSHTSGHSPQPLRKKPSIREIRELLGVESPPKEKKGIFPQNSFDHNEEMLLETQRPKIGVLSRTKSTEFYKFMPDKKISIQQLVAPIPDIREPLREPAIIQQMPKYEQKHIPLRGTFSPRSKQLIDMNTSGLASPRRNVKVKQLRLPVEKYDKVLQTIFYDTAQLADFTGAELGDHTTMQVLEQVRGKKVKSLKLIRCKLTDYVVDEMWNYLGNVQVLNLSQNYFTDKVLESFISNMSKVPHLKNLILSQNKINARNVKMRVEELKRFEVTVSL